MDEILGPIGAEPNAAQEAVRPTKLRTKLLSLALAAVILLTLALYLWRYFSNLNARIAELTKATARLSEEVSDLKYDSFSMMPFRKNTFP